MTRLLQGSPASGKTEAALEAALSHLRRRGRVLWVGLPHQRAYLLRRLARKAGAATGLEYLSWQQLYYRLVAEAGLLKPLVPGLERLALVARAMREEGLPLSPGLAALYARALAEHKRYGLLPSVEPLASVHRAYERLKGDRLDYDDFRLLAQTLSPRRLPALLVVDGFRRHNPLDLAFALALGERGEVLVTGVSFPEGVRPEALPPARLAPTLYRHPNPIEELRWTLRALKRDLAEGISPHHLLVVAPEGAIPGLLALGEGAGLPLWDGRPKRLLFPALQALLTPHPTGLDLLALAPVLPGLEAVGRRMVAYGVAGMAALEALAEKDVLAEFLALRRALKEGRLEVLSRLGAPHQDRLLLAYALARQIDPQDPLPWWEALLKEESLPPDPPRGILVLPPERATGVRARRAYLLRFFPEDYGAVEREDPFVPEEDRLPPSLPLAALPRRLSGDGEAFLEELLHRGDEATVVSYPEADERGPTFPPIPLRRAVPAPHLPAASWDEVAGKGALSGWRPLVRLEEDELRRVSLDAAQDLRVCPGRFALRRLFRDPSPSDPWEALLGYGKRTPKGLVLDGEALGRARKEHPEWEAFLQEEEERLSATRFWVSLRLTSDLPLYARAGGLNGQEVYALVPGGEEGIRPRLSESYFAQNLGLSYRVWPFGEAPRPLEPLPEWRLNKEVEALRKRLKKHLDEGFPFRPGWACRDCPVARRCPAS
ncbi:AAA family ATPase [Thermus filiformis]|uniref:hypothetical protein n=1 Tax=Thermus filiformis TaxID=276 RepID=UPI0005EC4F0D|nr:hypothetical protein [Thermus filiformis]